MKEVDFKSLQFNPAELIGNEWMLVGAGDENGYDAMTASWGHLGAIWAHGGGEPSAICYLRPQRFTKKYVDENEYYSLCFLDKSYKKALIYMGTHSGRDGEKAKECGLTPCFDEKAVYFKESHLVLICRKVYAAPILEEGFIDTKLRDAHYPKKDYHTFYVGLIEKALVNE